MNIVIPEFVQRVDYEKGPYYADVGDFGSAGSAHLEFYKTLPQDFVTLEGGMYGYERGVFGVSQKLGPGNILYGGEAYHDDGPWVNPDDYRKFNGILTYSQGDDANGFSVTARGYYGNGIPATRLPPVLARRIFSARSIRRTAAIRSVTACKPNGIARREFRDQNHGLRLLLRPRFVFRLHLLPHRPGRRRPIRAAGPALGGRYSTRTTRCSTSGLAATWKTRSACKSATTGSTTDFIRRKTACAWTKWIRRPATHSSRPTRM